MVMNDKLRRIPIKNYIILGGVILFTLFVLYYFYMWVDVYKESKSNYPILERYMTVINFNELDNYLVENPDVILYVSVLENDEIRDFEKKIKYLFKNNDIRTDILYMDITDELNDEEVSNNIVSNYSLNNLSMKSVPCVLVFEEGKLSSIYSISDNGYDINKFRVYLDTIEIGRDDNQ